MDCDPLKRPLYRTDEPYIVQRLKKYCSENSLTVKLNFFPGNNSAWRAHLEIHRGGEMRRGIGIGNGSDSTVCRALIQLLTEWCLTERLVMHHEFFRTDNGTGFHAAEITVTEERSETKWYSVQKSKYVALFLAALEVLDMLVDKARRGTTRAHSGHR
ncbi:hypothetical protein FA95DRAFT_304106 [Auriscalpium vulgare]|uniref:Uncharacterized protein n=1 Tax=Auriscalpium vulgare TaxID=40419 RepID=A0ACB8RJ11_9AGAM|nr:hypothetical protein FA95DRAFT_304106 [Auriscalpium vulgare]